MKKLFLMLVMVLMISTAASAIQIDRDNDGWNSNADCNDFNNKIHPGALEIQCNQIDENCNGMGDDDLNRDGDPVSMCNGDCNDHDSNIYPGNIEVCNGQDNDCNGIIDDTVFDDVYPVLIGVPYDETVECNSIPDIASVQATDNCAGITLDFTESKTDDPCEYVITRTWTATDAHGNIVSDTQQIKVLDTTAPVMISVPENELIYCGLESPVVYEVEDACNDFTSDWDYMTSSNPFDEPGIRTFWATDICGNSISTERDVLYVEESIEICDDGIDNDCDGIVDNCQPSVPEFTSIGALLAITAATGIYLKRRKN